MDIKSILSSLKKRSAENKEFAESMESNPVPLFVAVEEAFLRSVEALPILSEFSDEFRAAVSDGRQLAFCLELCEDEDVIEATRKGELSPFEIYLASLFASVFEGEARAATKHGMLTAYTEFPGNEEENGIINLGAWDEEDETLSDIAQIQYDQEEKTLMLRMPSEINLEFSSVPPEFF